MITFAPVPHTFSISTSPKCASLGSGADLIARRTSKYFDFSTALSVRTARVPPPALLYTVVIVRIGQVNSCLPYSAPRGQRFPLTTTSPFSSRMVKWHPIGQRIQTVCNSFILSPSLIQAACRLDYLGCLGYLVSCLNAVAGCLL